MGRFSSPALRKPRLWMYAMAAVLLPCLLVAVGVWLDGEYARMRRAGDLVGAISERRVRALDMLGNLRKAETVQRGFVITRNRAFLQRYEPSREAVLDDLTKLDTQFASDRFSHDRLASARSLILAKFAEMDEVMEVMQTRGQAVAVERVAEGRGQALMDRIEAGLQAIIMVDANRLAQSEETYWSQTQHSRHVVWALITAFGVMLMAGTLLLWRSKLERWRVAIAESDASTRNRAILDSTSDAIIILNPSGTIENVNAAARTVLGYDPRELRRRDVSVILDIADGEGSFHDRIGLDQGSLQRTLFVDRQARTRDGRNVPVDVALGLMSVPDGLHIVASVRDISHRREIERIKDDFIATVSHELRTPLTSVVGSLGLLRGGAAGALPEAASQLIEIAENNARRLIRLTNDILDLEKFGSGQMSLELETIDLIPLLRQSLAESEALARAKAVALRIEGLPRLLVRADRQRLLQVVSNLLSNAVRHTPDKSAVTVRSSVEQGRANVRIIDEGAGVPDEYREHIFDRFVQAPVIGAAGGTGLGLAIAREIMQRHGGAIWVEPAAIGKGACFTLALPLSDDPTDLGDGRGDQASRSPLMGTRGRLTGRTPTILQIDDDVDLVKVVAASFGDEARVIRADGLASARAILSRVSPDVVVLDIGLPDGTGLDILPDLIDADGRQLPTIIFSAQDSPSQLDGRVEAVLTKSRSSIPTLRDTIRRIIADGAIA
jgi:PAS domain S-box-containing protein